MSAVMTLLVTILFLLCVRVLGGLGGATATATGAVDIQNTRLTDGDAASLAATLPAVRALSLRAVVATEKSLISVLSAALTSPALHTLCLRNARMCSRVLAAAAKRLEEAPLPEATTVPSSAETGAGGAAGGATGGHVNAHLRTLDLSFNHYEEVRRH